VLAIDTDVLAGERAEVDAMVAAGGAQNDAFMHEAVLLHAPAQPALDQQAFDGMLQHAGTDAVLHVIAGMRLKHDSVDAALLQQVRQQQSGRPSADDADLGAEGGLLSAPRDYRHASIQAYSAEQEESRCKTRHPPNLWRRSSTC
jgi:hypothetical protein